jgi:hypothetical protein
VPDKRIFLFKKCFGCGSACSFLATTRNDYAGEQNKLVAVVAIALFFFQNKAMQTK